MTESPPFTYVGVDFFGPFMTRVGRRGTKRYGVIFTCLSVRACHIELACSLETSSFILALRRFVARRGMVKTLFSDNGRNFVGAQRELARALKELDQAKIHHELAPRGIEWRFNPPYASHMGGVWERQIRSIRKILQAILCESPGNLSDELLTTLFCEVEAILNSRPLTAISSDHGDPLPLSAEQLLTLKSSSACHAPGLFVPEDLYARRYWRRVQQLSNTFWKRWSQEYLSNLQPRAKWPHRLRNLVINDVVLIRDELLPRGQWPIGTVVQLEADGDGDVRTVWLRTAFAGRVRRCIHKLIFLFSPD